MVRGCSEGRSAGRSAHLRVVRECSMVRVCGKVRVRGMARGVAWCGGGAGAGRLAVDGVDCEAVAGGRLGADEQVVVRVERHL